MKCDGFFNMQRVYLSFTRDLHFMSYRGDTSHLRDMSNKAQQCNVSASVFQITNFSYFESEKLSWSQVFLKHTSEVKK